MRSEIHCLGLATLLACAPALAGSAEAPPELLVRQVDAAALARADAALQAAEALWRRQHVLNYRYVLERTHYGLPSLNTPQEVVVRDGQTQRQEPLRDVEALFTLIREAIRDQASAVSVRYDPIFGYPARIVIDPDSRIADEEIEVSVSGFQPR